MNEIDQNANLEIILRSMDRISISLETKLTLRYQVAAIFIALLSGVWTATAATIAAMVAASWSEVAFLSCFLILFGCFISIFLLAIWRIFTNIIITEEDEPLLTIWTLSKYVSLIQKDTQLKIWDEPTFLKHRQDVKTNEEWKELKNYIAKNCKKDSNSILIKIKNFEEVNEETKKRELLEKIEFDKKFKFGTRIAPFDIYALLAMISLYLLSFLISIIFVQSLLPNSTIIFLKNNCIWLFLIYFLVELIPIVLFEIKCKHIRRYLFWNRNLIKLIESAIPKINK
jgi:hypothetical protein